MELTVKEALKLERGCTYVLECPVNWTINDVQKFSQSLTEWQAAADPGVTFVILHGGVKLVRAEAT